MDKAEQNVMAEDVHADLPGITRVIIEAHGVAGVAFDESGSPLPCAVSVISSGSPFIIGIHGDLDIHSAVFLGERIRRMIDIVARRESTTETRDCILDLNHATYMDSRGMGVLIKAARDVQEAGGRLSLSHLPPKVHKVFTMTGMDKILTVIS